MKRAFEVFIILTMLTAPALFSCGKSAGTADISGTNVSETDDADSPFTVDFLSTGKSDCILVRADGYIILNDAADEDDYGAICGVLESYGITRIDRFIISHYDNDHIGSAANIINNFEVGEVMAPDFVVKSALYKKLIKAIAETGTLLTLVGEDCAFDAGAGRVAINAPKLKSYDDKNNYSLITSVYYGDYSFLLAGDALKERMVEFERVCVDAYTLVKLPHHGSVNKGLRSFLTNYPTQYAVYSSENVRGISAELLSLLDSSGTKVFTTAAGRVRAAIKDGELSVYYNDL